MSDFRRRQIDKSICFLLICITLLYVSSHLYCKNILEKKSMLSLIIIGISRELCCFIIGLNQQYRISQRRIRRTDLISKDKKKSS